MSAEIGLVGSEREVFISYRRLDNDIPTGSRGRHGFVSYLLRQLRSRLQEDGVPDVVLWRDRTDIEKGDIFSEAILKALNRAELFVAILSKNYIKSSWCEKELNTMRGRADNLGLPTGERRIFRVDKHKVPENQIPEALQGIEAVKFFREHEDAKYVDEFFWGGKVRLSKEFDKALLELTSAIANRLEELLQIRLPAKDPTAPQPERTRAISNGRILFVAKPSSDMVEYYRRLVEELRHTGFQVVPDPDEELSNRGEEVQAAVVNALAESEASLHLLGIRSGGRPCGFDEDLVPMQLGAAAKEAERKPGFERLIWAPVVLPGENANAKRGRRDPLKTIKRLGQQLLDGDQIYSDTAVNFRVDVLQRLARVRLGSD
jgi:TIR domain